jgi:error-prone DNA polymerase
MAGAAGQAFHSAASKVFPEDSGFVELWGRTNFSFLMGGSPPERLVQRARALGYDAIGIVDRDGIYGSVRAHEAGVEHGVRTVLGCELTLDPSDFSGDSAAPPPLVVYVENHAGYTHLCRILTKSHARHPRQASGRGRAKSERDLPKNLWAGLPLEEVCKNAGGLWAVIHPDTDAADVATIKEAFGERASIAQFPSFDGEDGARLSNALALSRRFEIPLLATNRVLFSQRAEKLVLDVLHCIREGVTLDEAGRHLLPNAEAYLKSREQMQALFRDRPEALARSRVIADACRFSLKELNYAFPCELSEPAFPGETADEALRRLTYEGVKTRYPQGLPDSVRAQIEKELGVITTMKVAPYFLSIHGIIEMAKRRDILCQGRGSAANSAVCFCLQITSVDPSKISLLFERFLSVERSEPPDIDVDFEHERREEIIQEIYSTYGRDRAAMVSEVVCYRGKSALREVGKVFGLSLEQVDRLSSVVSWWDQMDKVEGDRLSAVGFDKEDRRIRLVLQYAQAIQGYPRHLSIHVGGFVLSAEPLERVAPVEPAAMEDRTVIPWDKDDLDTLGFFKVDVLGLGILTAIRKAQILAAEVDSRVRADHAIERLAVIPKEDPVVYEALGRADTVGVFQIESRAQMAMLPRLLPKEFYDLVIEVAIVRPGPIQGGMVHPFLKRRNGEEEITMPHESLRPILERTLGVPLFQEQVMQIAIVGAGYSGGDADQLRRDMAAWRRNGRLERHRERLAAGFLAHGISEAFAERLFSQIQGFGEYGFPESHAASFASLVYASAWLKVHHPAAFAVGLINSQPMGFYSASTILQDAQHHGVEVLPIRIDVSHWDCTLEFSSKRAIRVGFRLVQGLSEEGCKSLEEARAVRPFSSIEDLATRTTLTQRELEALAEAGALTPLLAREIDPTRSAIWKVRAPREAGLLEGLEMDGHIPEFEPLTRAERLSLDYQRTGFSVDDHPMKLLRPALARDGIASAKDLMAMPETPKRSFGKPTSGEVTRRVKTAGYVICRQRPMTASGVVFITMEDETGFINLVLWSRVFEAHRHVATTSSILLVTGTIERQGRVVYVTAERLSPLSIPRSDSQATEFRAMSRDFH